MENTAKVAKVVKNEKIEVAETALQFFGRLVAELADDSSIDTATLVQQYQGYKNFADLAVSNYDLELAEKYGKLAEKVFEMLLARYHNLLFKAFHNLKTNGLSLNDNEILSACTDGFMSALMEYKDEKLKFAFTTIVYKSIKNEVSKTLAKIGKAISYNQTVLYRVKQINVLLGRGKSVEEIADIMGITPALVVNLGGVFGELNAIVSINALEEREQDKMFFTEDCKDNLVSEVKMWLKLCPNKRVSKVMVCVMGGMKYYQVAEKLKISLSMVKHDYQRGIEYLKECMVTK